MATNRRNKGFGEPRAGSLRERRDLTKQNEQPAGAPVVREQMSSGRRVGVVVRMNESGGFSFIRGMDGIEYFAHMTVYQPPNLYDVAKELIGTLIVSFLASETTKGWRAASVRAASDEEKASVGDAAENRGNR